MCGKWAHSTFRKSRKQISTTHLPLDIQLCVDKKLMNALQSFQYLTQMVRHWRREVSWDGQSPVLRGYYSPHESQPHTRLYNQGYICTRLFGDAAINRIYCFYNGTHVHHNKVTHHPVKSMVMYIHMVWIYF